MDTVFGFDNYKLGLICIKDEIHYNISGPWYTVGLLKNIEKLIKEYENALFRLFGSKDTVPERLLAFHKDGYILELEYEKPEPGFSGYSLYKLIQLYKAADVFVDKAWLIGLDNVDMDILEQLIIRDKCTKLF